MATNHYSSRPRRKWRPLMAPALLASGLGVLIGSIGPLPGPTGILMIIGAGLAVPMNAQDRRSRR